VNWPFGDLKAKTYSVVVIDPPWRFAGGTASRSQHYRRMTHSQVKALPVRALLAPEGGRDFLWITAPLLHRRPEIARAWRLRYSSSIPWIKLWGSERGLFVYLDSIARGTGFEVTGNAEYVAILKSDRPQSIKGRPFPGVCIEPRREHSRKPEWLHDHIEFRLKGPYAEVFGRQRAGWDVSGDEASKFESLPRAMRHDPLSL
jgi:N6-adenosine-specific RNA methylase IME4